MSRLVVISIAIALGCVFAGCAREMPARAMGDAGPVHHGDASTRAHDAGATSDAGPPVTCVGAAATCAALADRAHAYAMANPMRDASTWDGFSTSLVFRFAPFSRTANTADEALEGSTLVGTDATRAPIGAFHWWAMGTTGLVGIDLRGGGTTVFMASSHVQESWGTAIGTTAALELATAASARYLGWSMDYLGQRIDMPPAP